VLRDEGEPHIESFAKEAAASLDVALRLQLGHFTTEAIDLQLFRLHLAVPGKGCPGSGRNMASTGICEAAAFARITGFGGWMRAGAKLGSSL
jgi:hypothetical protein